MRCREARRRLSKYEREPDRTITDRELLDHIRACPACARQVAGLQTLRQMLNAAGENDTGEAVPLDSQKHLVENRLQARTRPKKWPAFTTAAGVLRRRPIVGYGLVFIMAVAAFMTFVPFNYSRTVGYEIAFDGVDKELADDIEQICDILFSLGLDQADVDVLGCDITCSLLIVDLKSPEEVQLVIAAFTSIDPVNLNTNVIPVRASTSGTLLDQASETMRQKQFEYR